MGVYFKLEVTLISDKENEVRGGSEDNRQDGEFF